MSSNHPALYDTPEMTTWTSKLIEAINQDNRDSVSCATSRTYALLRSAPVVVHDDVALAQADFDRSPQSPLSDLRSDTVANSFVVPNEPRLVVLVARMTVPGGPWPGHYGLEGVTFNARRASFPGWFPRVESPFTLHFATVHEASAGFSGGAGCVLFPEQISVIRKPTASSFGIVFLAKLTELFRQTVAPMLIAGSLPSWAYDDVHLRSIRELAFLAHEWGHVSADPEPNLVVARRRRAVAVLSEFHADLAALDLLLTHSGPEAEQAAVALVGDRIVREAWLPRSGSQVDAIAAKQLLRWLLEMESLTLDDHSRLHIDLSRPRGTIRSELAKARQAERSSTYADPSPAVEFLLERGWLIDRMNYRIDLSDPISQRLEAHGTDQWRAA